MRKNRKEKKRKRREEKKGKEKKRKTRKFSNKLNICHQPVSKHSTVIKRPHISKHTIPRHHSLHSLSHLLHHSRKVQSHTLSMKEGGGKLVINRIDSSSFDPNQNLKGIKEKKRQKGKLREASLEKINQ